MIDFFIAHGPIGMFLSAVLAGSVLPFASEVVFTALFAAGVDPLVLLLSATVGNTTGGLINYGIGRLGREDWIYRFAHVSPDKLEEGKRRVHRYGAWAGLLAWLPVLGSVITVALGYLRTNLALTTLTIATGKAVRYALLLAALMQV